MGYPYEKTLLSIEEIRFMRRFEDAMKAAHECAVSHGLLDYEPPKCCIDKLREEVEEFNVALSNDDESVHIPPFDWSAEELADIVITAMTTAKEKRIPLAQAIVYKMRFNQTREWKHGKE